MPQKGEISAIFAIAASFLLANTGLIAQITIEKPIHLSHVQGVVTDGTGRPIANAEIKLVRGEVVDQRVRSDATGRFQIDGGTGKYWLRVSGTGYSPAVREVVLGAGLLPLFRGKFLYVMLEQSACMDDCTWVFTSKKKFDHAVRWNTGHYD